MKALATLLALMALAAFAPAQKVKVKVGNEVVVFDAAPREVEGTTMVPLRSMVEVMGGTMRWDLQTRTVSVWNGGKRFDATLNSRRATVNEKAMQMDAAPIIIQNRIFVPLKFLADASGYVVSMEDGWYVLRPTMANTARKN